jgi:hypothetical protein
VVPSFIHFIGSSMHTSRQAINTGTHNFSG